jgi:hypothetical protein
MVETWVWDNRLRHDRTGWEDNRLRHETTGWDMRQWVETWDNRLRRETTGWDVKQQVETWDNRLRHETTCWDVRQWVETWDNGLRRETTGWDMRQRVVTWDNRLRHETMGWDVRQWVETWDNTAKTVLLGLNELKEPGLLLNEFLMILFWELPNIHMLGVLGNLGPNLWLETTDPWIVYNWCEDIQKCSSVITSTIRYSFWCPL